MTVADLIARAFLTPQRWHASRVLGTLFHAPLTMIRRYRDWRHQLRAERETLIAQGICPGCRSDMLDQGHRLCSTCHAEEMAAP